VKQRRASPLAGRRVPPRGVSKAWPLSLGTRFRRQSRAHKARPFGLRGLTAERGQAGEAIMPRMRGIASLEGAARVWSALLGSSWSLGPQREKLLTQWSSYKPFRCLHDCSGCFRLERFAGWALHPLESAAFSRRTLEADISRPHGKHGCVSISPPILVVWGAERSLVHRSRCGGVQARSADAEIHLLDPAILSWTRRTTTS
jgi:hypothetical protein